MNWLHSRTPDGRWYTVTWDKDPTIDDIDSLLRTLAVVREGYVPKKKPPVEVCGVRVIRLDAPLMAEPSGAYS